MTLCGPASTVEGSKEQLWLFRYSYFTKAVGVPLPRPNTHGPEATMRLRTRSKPRSPRFKHSPENSTRRPWKFSCSKTTSCRREAPVPRKQSEGGSTSKVERLQGKYALSTHVPKSRQCPDHPRACWEPRSVKRPCPAFPPLLNLVSVPSLGTDGYSFQAFICAVPFAWNALSTTHPNPGAHVPCPVLGSDVTSSRKPSLIPFP